MSQTYQFIVGDRSFQESAQLLEQLKVRSEHDLLAAIAVADESQNGRTTTISREDNLTTVQVPDIRDIFDPGKFTQGPEQEQLGRKIFLRWSSAFHDLVCGSDQQDQLLRRQVISILSGAQESGGIAYMAGQLMVHFHNLPFAVAVLVCTVTAKLVVRPAMDEVCFAWTRVLQPTKKRPSKRRGEKP